MSELCGAHLDAFTYEALLTEALSLAPDHLDKRQGSILYDTLSVGDVQLAQGYVQLKGYYQDVYAVTARGHYLDLRVAEAGIARMPATCAVHQGTFLDGQGRPASIPMDARFVTSQNSEGLVLRVTAAHAENGAAVPGEYHLTCETAGARGNGYTGELIPVTHINGLSMATLHTQLVAARDEESDEKLRERYLLAVSRPAFGGNVAQYLQWVLEMDGVGAAQVYPIWDGGGTVKVSIIAEDYQPASRVLVDRVQTALDPEVNQGAGLGLAPIGHVVTVSTPAAVPVDISASLHLQNGTTADRVRGQIEEQVGSYFQELRRMFGSADEAAGYTIPVYRARIASAIILIPGVDNVTDILINGEDGDLFLRQTPQEQLLPVEGTVTLHAV